LNKLVCTFFLVLAMIMDSSNSFAKDQGPKGEKDRVVVASSHDFANDALVVTAAKRGLKGPVKEVQETQGDFWIASSITEYSWKKSQSIYSKDGLLLYEEINNQGAMYGTSYVNGMPSSSKIINTTINKSIFESKNKYTHSGNIATLQEIAYDTVPVREHKYVYANGKISEHTIFKLSGEPYETTKVNYNNDDKTVQIITDTFDEGARFTKKETYSFDGPYRIIEQTVTNNLPGLEERSGQRSFFYDDNYNCIKITEIRKSVAYPQQMVSTVTNSEFTYSEFDKYGNWISMNEKNDFGGKPGWPPISSTRVITYYE
jgi:hypothetical protein